MIIRSDFIGYSCANQLDWRDLRRLGLLGANRCCCCDRSECDDDQLTRCPTLACA